MFERKNNMSDLNEKLISASKDENSKVEVLIKRDESNQAEELDLLHIFVNMGKKRRIYAWLIIISLLIGLAVPMLMAEMSERREEVSSVITLNYPGAEKLIAPDNTPLDVSYISSSYILQNALNKTKLSTPISAAALAANMKVERLLTENTRQNLEVMSQLMESTNKSAVSEVLSVDYQYENQIIITLTNGFGNKDSNNKVFLPGAELATLLNNITEEYNDYFFDTYSRFALPDDDIANVDMASMDYIERLDSMLDILNVLSRYCNDKDKEAYLSYRSKLDGMSFKDIYECVKLVKDIDIDYLYAYVFYNCIALDRTTTVTKYEYALRNSQQALKVLAENIETNANVISNYKNDNILVASADGATNQISSSVTDYYNELILKQAQYYQDKADTLTAIDNLNDKISGFKTSASTQQQLDYVESELKSIYNITSALYGLVKEHANEIINSDFYQDSYITIVGAQYEGQGIFSSATIKKAVIGAVVGVVLAVVVWCCDGLIMEFRLSNAKKEEYEAKKRAAEKKESREED